MTTNELILLGSFLILCLIFSKKLKNWGNKKDDKHSIIYIVCAVEYISRIF